MNPTLTTTAKLPNPTLASNEEVADKFNRLAWHLEHQKASPYRAQAWRNAAKTIRVLERSVLETARHEGLDRLISYPAIGKGIAGALGSYARTGRLHLLDVLEGQYDPVELFACVNSIGRELGQRIHETLEISTLEELARACWDGRLDRVPGIGRHRLHDIRNDLDTLFQTRERALLPGSHPSPDPLLDLDREFRLRAQIGRVERFRYKPPLQNGNKWLEIWHASRKKWHFTLTFSNSTAARKAGKTRDWVIVFYENPEIRGQVTIVSPATCASRNGCSTTRGERIIRGLPS